MKETLQKHQTKCVEEGSKRRKNNQSRLLFRAIWKTNEEEAYKRDAGWIMCPSLGKTWQCLHCDEMGSIEDEALDMQGKEGEIVNEIWHKFPRQRETNAK